MSTALNNRLIYFSVFILIITILGFYKTYLIKFPTFEGFTNAHHIHGALALTWILMLIVQPILIQRKRLDWHRIVGKVSYITMPLMILSFFFVAKAGYERNSKIIPEADALAELANGIPDIFVMSAFYALAIYFKKNTAFHLRFMSATGLMVLGPGLGRFLIVFCAFPPQFAIPIIILFSTGIGLAWLVMDIRNKKSAFPMGAFVATGILVAFININNHAAWWQGFAKLWVNTLF
jgi:hypothetical protein